MDCKALTPLASADQMPGGNSLRAPLPPRTPLSHPRSDQQKCLQTGPKRPRGARAWGRGSKSPGTENPRYAQSPLFLVSGLEQTTLS